MCLHEAPGERGQRRCHARRSYEQQRSTADPVNEQDRNDAGNDGYRARYDVDPQGICFIETGRLPEHRPIVEDDVDADELLE